MLKENIFIIVSLHFHPGLESEIKLICEEKNGFFFGSENYKTISNRISLISLFSKQNNVFIYNTSLWNILLFILKYLTGFRLIYCLHEPVLPLSIKNSYSDVIKCIVVNFIHHISFVVSNELMVFSDCGYKKVPRIFRKKVKVGILPFDIRPLLPYRLEMEKKLESKIFTVLFYGNVNSGKDPIEFVTLFSKCCVENLKLRLVSTTEHDLKRWKKFSSDKIQIEFVENLSDLQILDLLRDCDIVLLPHKRCTQSAILERSTFLGIPVIFGSCNCFEEHIGIYGIRFMSNESEFLSSILGLISSYNIFKNNCLNRHKFLLSD